MYQELNDIRGALLSYIEAAYHLSNEPLNQMRRELLDQPGIISQSPFLESTARYDSSRRYDQLSIDPELIKFFSYLANDMGGSLIHNPPYTHQAEAIERTLGPCPEDLVITTGTGSGKTETFLLPILGRLAVEAQGNPNGFSQRAVRAILLYPMNALVNDQLGRLRLLLGARKTREWFMERGGRPAKFGRYTSRTPFPGIVPQQTRQLSRKLTSLRYYERIEKSAADGDREALLLMHQLAAAGKWPAKPTPDQRDEGFCSWFGGGSWRDSRGDLRRTIERPFDPELLTRHEMQAAPPDLLVTNYSMLEYMMIRPIERTIFDRSCQYYDEYSEARLLLVLDEAHLYRGAQGTEIGLLIRRLRQRLGLKATQLQVIATSASFQNKEASRTFVAGLAGKGEAGFSVLAGQKRAHQPSGPGDLHTMAILAAVDLPGFWSESPALRTQALRPLLTAWARPEPMPAHFYEISIPVGESNKTSSDVTFRGLLISGEIGEETLRVAVGGRRRTTGAYLAPVELRARGVNVRGEREDGLAALELTSEGGLRIPRGLDALSRLLFELLQSLPVLGRLLNLTSGTLCEVDPSTLETSGGPAREIEALARMLFPQGSPEQARRATDVLVELASFARESPKATPLLAARVHQFLRGVPGVWACSNPNCHALPEALRGQAPIGALYAQPRRTCECGCRVFELHACRDCGLAFLEAWTVNPAAPEYLWNQNIGEIDDTQEVVQSLHLMLEDVSLLDETAPPVQERYLDPLTGRMRPVQEAELDRLVWIPQAGGGLSSEPGHFATCPRCGGRGSRISNLGTKGDEPFQSIISRQLLEQPPRPDIQTPLKGRKALIFSDGRQPASRLAGKLKDNSLRDSVRPLLLAGYRLLERKWGNAGQQPETRSLEHVYAALLSGAAALGVTLTPQLLGAEINFPEQAREVAEILGNSRATWPDFCHMSRRIATQTPHAILLALYEVLVNRLTGLQPLALGLLVPHLNRLPMMVTVLENLVAPGVPADLSPEDRKKALLSLWTWLMIQERALYLSGTPAEWIGGEDGARLRLQEGRFTQYLRTRLGHQFHQRYFQVQQMRPGPWLNFLRQYFGTAENAGRMLLHGQALLLVEPDATTWVRCLKCMRIHPANPLMGCHCPACNGKDTLIQFDPETDPVFQRRTGIYRTPAKRLDGSGMAGEVPHPFVAEEHSAAISTVNSLDSFSRAEWYEMRFQDLAVKGPLGEPGTPIDVLSCTTTMEVGIDIGSLTAVALRNVPPGRANYQQRAGRAGRRGSALSTVITYADNDTHNQRYFDAPADMISGPVTDPILNLDNEDIVIRHCFALLLSLFQQEMIPAQQGGGNAAQANVFSSLGTVRDFRLGGDHEFSFRGLAHWLEQRQQYLRQELEQIVPDQMSAAQRVRVLEGCASALLVRLEAIGVGPLDPAEAAAKTDEEEGDDVPQVRIDFGIEEDLLFDDDDPAPVGATALPQLDERAEVAEAARDQGLLLNRLFDHAVLPSYAFPTEVVSMTVFDAARSTPYQAVAKYAPQQGLHHALSAYAPGREVFIDGLRHYSFAIWSPMRTDRQQAWERRQLYFECYSCGFAQIHEREQYYEGQTLNCPACGARRGLGPAILWLTPPGFAHPRDMQEDLAVDEMPLYTRPTRAKLSAPFNDDSGACRFAMGGDGRGFLHWAAKEHLFVTNRGNEDVRRPGFRYCLACGRIEPNGWQGERAYLNNGLPHPKPYPNYGQGGEICNNHRFRLLSLGYRFKTDIALFRFQLGEGIRLRPGSVLARLTLTTLAQAMSLTAVTNLEVERGDIEGEFRPAMTVNGQSGREVDIYLYDTSAGGAGFVRAATAEPQVLLEKTLARLENCTCTHSCYKCLRTYENRFDHEDLDRHLAAALLRYLLYGKAPDLPEMIEDILLDQWHQDLKDCGQEVIRGAGYLELPRHDRRRLVLAHAFGPTQPGTERAAQALQNHADHRIVEHLKIERALPEATRLALTAQGTGESTDTFALPSFLTKDTAGIPVYRFADLDQVQPTPLATVRVEGAAPGCFLTRLEHHLFERSALQLSNSGTQTASMGAGTWLVFQPVEKEASLVSDRPCLVQHMRDVFRATGMPMTVALLQERAVNGTQYLAVRYRSMRRECAPETIPRAELRVMAKLEGLFIQTQYHKL